MRRSRSKKNKNLRMPQELLIQILLRLPVKSLVRFKCVSKSWLSLISDPHFARSHFELAPARIHRLVFLAASAYEARSIDSDAPLYNHSSAAAVKLDFLLSQSYPHAEIKGSCRGFLLLDCYTNLYVWNPSTGVHKRISCYPLEPKYFTFIHGFGYDPSTDDYLVVQASYDPGADLTTHMEIFSLRTNTWKQIEGAHFPYMNSCDDARVGSLLNGAIHWLVWNYDLSLNVIVAFDLTERSCSEIPLPDDFFDDFESCELWVLGGFLSLWAIGEGTTDIWVMEEYKVHSSWTKAITVSTNDIPTQYFSPICSTKNGDIVGLDGTKGFVKYNDKGLLQEYCNDSHGCQVAMYTESLLSLPGHTEQPEEDE
ncbi:F-box/kelch-repeat protein At3g23880-like [Gastrolobium bilobum]|uniref:F-box/kelch-repeat protein At3g23880-like n=1 Tax=Gastrolobium bilobum TaxID=150636 RepID=UPI002AB07DE7|nr:F-box/kelch-repeat protein At3g23880-like [Gastrolobium bilobum]